MMMSNTLSGMASALHPTTVAWMLLLLASLTMAFMIW
jgi:hypothetical protein